MKITPVFKFKIILVESGQVTKRRLNLLWSSFIEDEQARTESPKYPRFNIVDVGNFKKVLAARSAKGCAHGLPVKSMSGSTQTAVKRVCMFAAQLTEGRPRKWKECGGARVA
jgi:hypothetical protein